MRRFQRVFSGTRKRRRYRFSSDLMASSTVVAAAVSGGGMICHVERSRDISNYSCSKSQRFLDSARNARWKTLPPETTAATTAIRLSSSSPRAARQRIGREAPIYFRQDSPFEVDGKI